MMLSHMTGRLLEQPTFEGAMQTILDDAIALLGAEYGNLQLLIGDQLVIVVQRGLSPAFLHTFRIVKKEDGSACGRALRFGRPVIVPDVEKDAEFAAFRIDARNAGFRAVQTTPLLATNGNLLGLVSTHFAAVHEPTEIEMQTLQEYGVIAAEHAYNLLGDMPLSIKAKQMNVELYGTLAEWEA